MADQPVTREKLINADKDVQTIEDFIKKPKDETVTTRFGDEIMTLKGLEEEVKKSGGYFKRYATLAAANADIATIPVNSVVKVTDAVNGGDYEKATAGATSLTKSAHDPLTQSKQYADNLLTTELSTATDLNTLAAGNYFLSTSNLNALVDAGDFITLSYPADTVKSGGVKLNVVRKGSFTYQTLEFPQQGRILTRQGAIGSSFTAWISGASDAIKHTDNELNKKFGTVTTGTSLNTFINAGTWGISGSTVFADSKVPEMGYPEELSTSSAVLTVAQTASNYAVQEFTHGITKYKRILHRATGAVFEDWQVLGTPTPSATAKKTFLTYGSSSMSYMSAKIKTMIESFNATYISDAIGGQILETMQAHQGSNPVSIVFNDGVTALNNIASAVTVTQKDDLGSLTAKGSFAATLSNGLKGTLNLDANTFTASNATEIYNVGSLSFDVDFGYLDYAQAAYHIFNIGKNNITMGNYTAQQVLDETNKMIDFIKNKGNQNFIVGGHFADRGMVASQKQTVLEVNAALKAKYGLKYFDMQDYLMSAQIWTDLNITPTQDDLDKQAAGELAVSLSRDSKHLSSNVDTLMVDRLKQKLQDLSYL